MRSHQFLEDTPPATEPDDEQQRYEHETQEHKMADIDDVFAGNFLKASDITGKEPTVIIQAINVQEFKGRDGKPQRKLVMAFQGAKKEFVCNKVNANRIAYMHGKDYTKWVGKKITLFVDPFVEYGGQQTPGIRVKPPTYAQPVPQAPQTPDELLPVNDPLPAGRNDSPFNDDPPF